MVRLVYQLSSEKWIKKMYKKSLVFIIKWGQN